MLIENFPTGGAEQDDAIILRELGIPYERMLCGAFSESDPDKFYLIGNFTALTDMAKASLFAMGNYTIYEHDYKFHPSRNPMAFKDLVVPREERTNIKFYECARKVICVGHMQAHIFSKNDISKNVVVTGGSFWSDKELDYIDFLREDRKKKGLKESVALHSNHAPLKGPEVIKKFLELQGKSYEFIERLPHEEFLYKLSRHTSFGFFPLTPETCSRVIVEAKMMEMELIVRGFIGATYEPWYQLNGKELIKYCRTEMKNTALKVIRDSIYPYVL